MSFLTIYRLLLTSKDRSSFLLKKTGIFTIIFWSLVLIYVYVHKLHAWPWWQLVHACMYVSMTMWRNWILSMTKRNAVLMNFRLTEKRNAVLIYVSCMHVYILFHTHTHQNWIFTPKKQIEWKESNKMRRNNPRKWEKNFAITHHLTCKHASY